MEAKEARTPADPSAGVRLALPCGHELVVPADTSVPGMSVSVLGHQLACPGDAPDVEGALEFTSFPPPESRRRGRRALLPGTEGAAMAPFGAVV